MLFSFIANLARRTYALAPTVDPPTGHAAKFPHVCGDEGEIQSEGVTRFASNFSDFEFHLPAILPAQDGRGRLLPLQRTGGRHKLQPMAK